MSESCDAGYEDSRNCPCCQKASGRVQSEPRVLGYVLVDPNTGAMDWDGVIHERLQDAIDEVVGIKDNPLEDARPCRGGEVPYEVAEVTVDAAIQARVLKAMQARWDRDEAMWTRIGEES